jgi:hypothetical protein
MAWLILIVPVVSVAVLIWLRRTAQQVGLPPMTPFKLSAAVSQANKLGQDALSVTLVQSETNRAIGPMATVGWQINTATADRSVPAWNKRITVTFCRVPAGPSHRYEYLYDRDTWVRLPSSHREYLADPTLGQSGSRAVKRTGRLRIV